MSSRIWGPEASGRALPWRAESLAAPKAAAAVVRNPAAEAEAKRREARDAGYQEGRAQGTKDGLAHAKAHADQIARLLHAAQNTCDAFEAQLADQVVDLAIELARQVLRNDPRLRREALADVAREALAQLGNDARAPQIVLHPADVAPLKAHIGEELARGEWTIVEDLRMEPGGFRITTANGEVDATLATRWRRVLAALGREGAWRIDNE